MDDTTRKNNTTCSNPPRPKIEDFVPRETGLGDIHRMFTKSPELYRYICALDLYIDELEVQRDADINQNIEAMMKDFNEGLKKLSSTL